MCQTRVPNYITCDTLTWPCTRASFTKLNWQFVLEIALNGIKEEEEKSRNSKWPYPSNVFLLYFIDVVQLALTGERERDFCVSFRTRETKSRFSVREDMSTCIFV